MGKQSKTVSQSLQNGVSDEQISVLALPMSIQGPCNAQAYKCRSECAPVAIEGVNRMYL
jgi:hypothetical protein